MVSYKPESTDGACLLVTVVLGGMPMILDVFLGVMQW